MNNTRKLLYSFIPKSLKQYFKKAMGLMPQFHENYSSFSDCAEDRILFFLFKFKDKGFYIDIGAYKPITVSNTYFFYLKGWHGINIDAFPGSMNQFNIERPLDINLEIGISEKRSILPFYVVNNSLSPMNSFNKNNLEQFGIDKNNYNSIEIQSYPLAEVLDKYLPLNQEIDFMNIDVEGFEMEVLKSNNWIKYNPKVIILENFEKLTFMTFSKEIIKYLENKHYELRFITPNAYFFLNKNIQLSSINRIVC